MYIMQPLFQQVFLNIESNDMKLSFPIVDYHTEIVLKEKMFPFKG